MRDEAIYQAFGRQIAARRTSLKKSQKDVAIEVGLSRASIANIESGRQSVLLHQVYALAEALEMQSVAEILPRRPRSVHKEPSIPINGTDMQPHQSDQVAKFLSEISLGSNLEPKK